MLAELKMRGSRGGAKTFYMGGAEVAEDFERRANEDNRVEGFCRMKRSKIHISKSFVYSGIFSD